MAPIQHILFPFDFSAAGLRAAPFVRALANSLRARVTLLSVMAPTWVEPLPGLGPMVAVDPEELHRQLQALLDRTLTEELDGLDVARITAAGDPALRITEFAHDNAVDLIMMPTHGSGLFRRLLIGSVTAKVSHDAKCPVWTAAHTEKQHAPDLPKNVLCALDASEESLSVLQRAAEFCRQIDAALNLLHVVRPASDWLALESERELQEELRNEARTRIEAIRKSAGVNAPLRVAVGEIAATVAEEARQEGADLILLGRGSLQSTLGSLRTHAYGIIQSSPCPVLSV
jgi:nucleotide-binding universal stress UspA family protein